MSTCTATWPGGTCPNDPAHLGLCSGHYQQQHRGRPFTALRTLHAKDPRDLRPLTVGVPAEDLATLTTESESRAVPLSEVVREGLAEHVQRIRERDSREGTKGKAG